LKTVAYPDNELAFRGMNLYGIHDLGKPGYGSASKIIAVGEAPREYDTVIALKLFRIVPYIFNLLAQNIFDRMKTVDIAVGSGKNDYAEFHSDVHL
jgi:hypothetical protein